ncbi:MAG TPA: sulfatase-like hydrolase/transferase [Xanthomonadales bacterium]|nr:sulfatase-like hydrolase/transferase [Xanthomonadales bacterium]
MRQLLILKFALLAGGVLLTNHFFLGQLALFVKLDLYHWLAVFLLIWAAAGIALFYVAFTPRKGARVTWALLLGLSTLAGETYFQVVGDRLTIGALDAMWDPAMLNLETVAFYARQAGLALLYTAVLLAGLMIPLPLPAIPRWRTLVLSPLAPCFLIAAVIVYDAASTGIETQGLPSQFYNLSLLTLHPLSAPPPTETAEVDIPLVRPPAARHVVLIVDESVSGDFIDVNVERGTTPYLLTYPAGMVNFGLATAASTCSNASNAILRLGAKPELLGSRKYSPFANPSVWKYAKKAGFETNFVDAQRLAESGQNFMYPAELRLIDHVLTVPRGTPAASRDFEAQKLVQEVLSRPEPQFIYVNKQGAHFPYQNWTPENEALFLPVMQSREAIGNRERLVNSYKNAIHWTVDRFFESLLPRIDLTDTVIIYTSDHGQNLLDDGLPVTHCRRLGVQLNEAVVPLLTWTENQALHQRFLQAAKMNFGSVSHFEIFPALLDLFGYDPAIVRDRYHQSLFERIDQPLGFISGPVTGRFGRKPLWNSRDGLHQQTR